MAEVIWTDAAVEDLDAIAEYIARDKPGAAKRLVRQVFSRAEQLALFPDSGSKPRDLVRTPYRQLVVSPLRIFYRVNAGAVYIVYVMREERRFRLNDLRARE